MNQLAEGGLLKLRIPLHWCGNDPVILKLNMQMAVIKMDGLAF